MNAAMHSFVTQCLPPAIRDDNARINYVCEGFPAALTETGANGARRSNSPGRTTSENEFARFGKTRQWLD
ncbi:hypothetical protein FHT70_002216 [Rhizobium sp. BK049]|nr:hypothetical protein [Rhizobium sp. BK049]